MEENLVPHHRMLLHRWNHFRLVVLKPQCDENLFQLNMADIRRWEDANPQFRSKNTPTRCISECGCPQCKPLGFNKLELKIWNALTHNYCLTPPGPARNKRALAVRNDRASRELRKIQAGLI